MFLTNPEEQPKKKSSCCGKRAEDARGGGGSPFGYASTEASRWWPTELTPWRTQECLTASVVPLGLAADGVGPMVLAGVEGLPAGGGEDVLVPFVPLAVHHLA